MNMFEGVAEPAEDACTFIGRAVVAARHVTARLPRGCDETESETVSDLTLVEPERPVGRATGVVIARAGRREVGRLIAIAGRFALLSGGGSVSEKLRRQHTDRDAQFRYIARQVRRAQRRSQPSSALAHPATRFTQRGFCAGYETANASTGARRPHTKSNRYVIALARTTRRRTVAGPGFPDLPNHPVPRSRYSLPYSSTRRMFRYLVSIALTDSLPSGGTC